MNQAKIAPVGSRIIVEPSRKRETPRPPVTFRKVLEGGAQVLLAGAKVATHIVGGPLLSAAVPSGTGPGDSATGGLKIGAESEHDSLAAFHQQRLDDDLKLLALQDRIQRNNRQIALISNVMKARHDTAKAAIGNIRS